MCPSEPESSSLRHRWGNISIKLPVKRNKRSFGKETWDRLVSARSYCGGSWWERVELRRSYENVGEIQGVIVTTGRETTGVGGEKGLYWFTVYVIENKQQTNAEEETENSRVNKTQKA